MNWYKLHRRDAGTDIVGRPDNACEPHKDLDLLKTYSGFSGPYPTEEAALAALAWESGQPPTRCKVCGFWIDFSYRNWKTLAKRGMCFMCDTWTRTIEKHSSRNIVIQGVLYQDGGYVDVRNTGTPSHHLGFGGRLFIIQFKDGRLLITNNLWCGGDIPERFRSKLPDNASFVPHKY